MPYKKPKDPTALTRKANMALPIMCEALRKNKGRVSACKEAGIEYTSFLRWMDRYAKFANAIKKAELEALDNGKEYAIAAIFRAMGQNWTAAAWWLERKFPDEFAKREPSGPNNDIAKVEYDIIDRMVKNAD